MHVKWKRSFKNIRRISFTAKMSKTEHRRMDGLLRDDVVRSTASSPGIKETVWSNTHYLCTFCERVLFYVAHSKQHMCSICKTA